MRLLMRGLEIGRLRFLVEVSGFLDLDLGIGFSWMVCRESVFVVLL